jgi:hypothetical protein
MTYQEILAEHKKDAESVNRAAQTYDFRTLFNSGPGIDKDRDFIPPETYGRMRGLLDTVAAPAGAGVKEHLENSFERQILVKMLYPNASGNAARGIAAAFANTVAGRLGHPQKATDVWKNSIKAGLLERDAAALSYTIMMNGGVPSADQAEAQKWIAERRAKLGSVATNGTITSMVGQTLQSLAMTKDGMLFAAQGSFTAGLLGAAFAGAGTIVPGAGTAAGALAAGAVYIAGQLGRTALNRKLYQGQEYEKMVSAGIGHETAKRYWGTVL